MYLKRILLVDDDMEDQFLFTHALDCLNLSIQCKTVGNGQEALDHLGHSSNYEMIFLDLNMPVMNGLNCLKAIKENEKYSQIPVVIFTTSVNPSDIEFCKNIGVNSIFHKPNSFPELCMGLNNLLGSSN